MMNQKRGLTDSVTCLTMKIPGRRIYLTETRSKRKTPVEHR